MIADELQGCTVGQRHFGVTASHTVLPQVSWACPLSCEATESQNLEFGCWSPHPLVSIFPAPEPSYDADLLSSPSVEHLINLLLFQIPVKQDSNKGGRGKKERN